MPNRDNLFGIAPRELLCEDFRVLDAQETLRVSWEIERLILMQSVEGHSHMGHGEFHGKKYPNTTIDDIARALKLNPMEVKSSRQILIDEIREYALLASSGRAPNQAVNRNGEPILRIGLLRHLDVEPLGVLRGLYVGGMRDIPKIRFEAERRYQTKIGAGKSYVVDKAALERLGLNGETLAHGEHEHEIERFRQSGLIYADSGPGDSRHAYMYIRHRKGPGASDDAAIVMAGKLWGFSAAVGCFLADAIDTLEKYVPVYSDQDFELAEEIAANTPNLDLEPDDAVRLAFLASIPEDEQGRVPDCSLRHFLSVDMRIDQCALESHLQYVAGKPYSNMVLDHGEADNTEFYEYIERRLAEEERPQ